jgi:translation initiation factor 2B subunit (eIF-2B alpha/beta/delta family)/8-oxo-dGTP pyrophosphatase MutT (NUDIX family)
MTDRTDVVTAFLRHDGELLFVRRSEAVGTYRGRWGGVSGYAEGDPDGQVRREVREETGIDPDRLALVRSGRPLDVDDGDRRWRVHPYLFDAPTREVELSEEHDAHEWAPAPAMLDRETVPALWAAYERVAPDARSIAADDDHGAAALSMRALEVLRNRAALARREDVTLGELRDLAARLRRARPSMAVLHNRVNRAVADADGPADVERAATAGTERAVAADREAAAAAAELLDDAVLTLSRSGTVRAALRRADPERVYVAESRPAGEGVAVAEALAADPDVDAAVTVHTDAAVAHVLATAAVDAVVVGADTVLPDGRVLNKTGTRAAALAAAHEGVPVYAVAAADKVTNESAVALESGAATAVYDGDAPLDALNPTFDVTPADAVTVVTEDGPLDGDAVAALAERHRDLTPGDGGDDASDDAASRRGDGDGESAGGDGRN